MTQTLWPLLCVWVLTVPAELPTPQGQSSGTVNLRDKEVLRVMQQGTLEQRQQAMHAVIDTGSMSRSPEIRRVVAAELERMNKVVEQRQDKIVRGESDPGAPDIGPYLGLLAEACSSTDDPVVIDALIGVIDTGNMVESAVARFDGIALDRVAAVALSDAGPMKVSGALRVLTKMLDAGPKSAQERDRILAIAQNRMERTQHPIIWGSAIRLAVATGLPGLQAKVEAIAAGALILPGAEGPEGMDLVKRSAEAALKQKR
jgi:hypothetical protein